MITLGIHDGHVSGAALVVDGRLVAAVSEERLTRKKEQGGWPQRSIELVLRIAGVEPGDVDAVGVATLFPPITSADYDLGHPARRAFGSLYKLIPKRFLENGAWLRGAKALAKPVVSRRQREILRRLREMGFRANVRFYEHHYAHAFGAYLLSGFEKALLLTADGSGDMLSATVALAENGRHRRVSEVSNYNSIGEFYTRVTQFLGMKPLSHEYKVMGLAPYAPESLLERVYPRVRKLFEVDGKRLVFVNKAGVWKRDWLRVLRKVFDGVRFDAVAGAAQRLLEEVITAWAKASFKKLGFGKLVLAGGIFANVKLNYKLLELEEVEELFVMPSPGDDSLPLAAAALAYFDEAGERPEPLRDLYLGPEFSDGEVEKALEELSGFKVEFLGEEVHRRVAELLARGFVVGRFWGRMEFGARALGARSILADPRDFRVVERINRAIKKRDFWMPFAPTVLAERADEYLVNSKGHFAPYMVIAFPTKPQAWEHFPAALHPRDKSTRPQMLLKSWEPTYYEVLKRFEELTGVPAVLNTSFNLHGDPIVCTPRDAIYTFLNSDLDALALGKWLICRRNPPG